jgi:hypothetical protein
MVVGRAGIQLAPTPRVVRARAARVAVGRRHCSVAAGTPLAALAALRRAGGPRYRVRDFASCSRHSVDASGLYVSQIGHDRARGQDGWVYKVGNRAGSAGAGDTRGPFGTGRRLRGGQRLLWFWCRMGPGGCQRTLVVAPAARRVAHGGALQVTVRGYDDNGHGVPVAGAIVILTSGAAGTTSMAITDANGEATVHAPNTAPRALITATRAGLAPSFPEAVLVG